MRKVVCGDALDWLASAGEGPIVTSPPDMAEMNWDYPIWSQWFDAALHACLATAGQKYPAVFYVTDRRYAGTCISKAHLVIGAAHDRGLRVLWHKIALRRDVGKIDLHRPTYSHMVAVGGQACRPGPQSPDVFHRGPVLYPNGMGVEAARYACRFLAKYGYVYNPFCGRGTVLAAANEIGLDAVGIDNDQRQCDYSEHATLPE